MKKYDLDFKISVVEAYKNGLTYKEIREKFHVTKTCFYDWLKLYNTEVHQKEKTFTYKQYEELQKRFDKISRELEIIKLSHCFADSPRKQKEEAIERLIDKFPIKEMCRVLDLPVGTFYNYHLRRVDTTQNQIRDEYLKEEIIKIFNESGQRFCAPKIATKLSELGINTTKKKVSNLMEQMGIKSKQCKKRTFEKKQGKLASCKNYLNRHFEQSEPNKFWVGDVTTIFIKNNKFYLCVIIDLFSRKVVAYRLSAQNNSNLTVNTFKDAFEERNRPVGLCFHSVKEYMDYYNDYRPHLSLKNKTPNQVENDYELSVLSELSA